MINALLRSGSPDDFLMLGENGQAVFDSARQIRETLRLRNQQAIADLLAIPQMNDSGSRIDWYAPHPGPVTRWTAASEEQRAGALRYLEHCQTNVKLLSTQCLRSDKTALRLFGSLLTKILQFPASQYLYLVNDKPVITFWGFVNAHEAQREDSLACLQLDTEASSSTRSLPHTLATPVVDKKPLPEPASTLTPTPDIAATYAVEIESVETEVSQPNQEPPHRASGRGLMLFSLGALFLILAITSYWIFGPSLSEPKPRVGAMTAQIIEPVAPTVVAAIAPSHLPLMQATVIPEPIAESPTPEVAASTAKGALVLPAEQLKMGSTQFLNGSWQVRVQFSDPIAGKPPTLRYRIRDNKGTVRLSNSDNVSCQAQVFSGLHQSGVLMIKSRGNARCDDGTRHVLPEISCKAGINGVAECTGRYQGDTQVPVTIQKVSN